MHEDWLVPIINIAAKYLIYFHSESLGKVLSLVSYLSRLHTVINAGHLVFFDLL